MTNMRYGQVLQTAVGGGGNRQAGNLTWASSHLGQVWVQHCNINDCLHGGSPGGFWARNLSWVSSDWEEVWVWQCHTNNWYNSSLLFWKCLDCVPLHYIFYQSLLFLVGILLKGLRAMAMAFLCGPLHRISRSPIHWARGLLNRGTL